MQNDIDGSSLIPKENSIFKDPELTRRIARGTFVGGAGAAILAGTMYSLWAAKQGPKPMFLASQQKQFGHHGGVDHIAGIGRFVLAGAAWGAVFGGFTSKPTVAKGMAFGFLPSLFLWTVLAPMQGEKLFFGGKLKSLAMPVLFNSAIWGTFIGKTAKLPAPQVTLH